VQSTEQLHRVSLDEAAAPPDADSGEIITVGPREATADISKHCSQWKEQWLLMWLAIRKGTDRVTGTG
jgi:hypothetical protein